MQEFLSLLPLGQINANTTGPAPTTDAAPPVTGGPVMTATTEGAAPTSQAAAASQPKGPPPSPFSGILNFLPLILMFVVLYFILFRGQRKEEKRRKQMVSEMKKGDKVMTIGGLVARVVSIDGEEVVLKIDESANVKATYKKSSIQQVLGGDETAK